MDSLLSQVRSETGWKSASRISGEACERFVFTGFVCPRCQGSFVRCPPNTPFHDMICARCTQRFQIKATRRDVLPSRLLGSAYHTTRDHLSGLDFLVVLYPRGEVYHMPHERIRRSMVRPRNTLSSQARRAGWRGCTLWFHKSRYTRLDPTTDLRWGRSRPRTTLFRRVRTTRRLRRSLRKTNCIRPCPLCTSGT